MSSATPEYPTKTEESTLRQVQKTTQETKKPEGQQVRGQDREPDGVGYASEGHGDTASSLSSHKEGGDNGVMPRRDGHKYGGDQHAAGSKDEPRVWGDYPCVGRADSYTGNGEYSGYGGSGSQSGATQEWSTYDGESSI
jgi:hypothetical protein